MVWEQASRWHLIQKTTVTRTTPWFNGDKATKRPAARNPAPSIKFHLGEWDVKDMFGLAMAVAGQALIGAIIHRGWDSNTFQHETWGFEWEELAALIYLIIEYKTDCRYLVTLEHFYTVIMQPQDILRLHRSVRGDIYDSATWIAVAHSQLYQDPTQLTDDQRLSEDATYQGLQSSS